MNLFMLFSLKKLAQTKNLNPRSSLVAKRNAGYKGQKIGDFLDRILLMHLRILLLLFSTIPLSAIEHNLTYTITQDNVTLNAHLMPRQECSNTFLHNLIAYQLCSLQLVITNNSEKSLMVSGNSIEELLLVPPNTITSGMIYKNQTMATIIAYACALTGCLAFFTGFSAVQQSLPAFVTDTTKYLSSAAALAMLLYQAHRFATKLSQHYILTQASIMRYGLSNTNVIIDPNTSATLVMFLNNKSYSQQPAPLDTFYYLFSVKLYNLYDSTDIITIPVEVPKTFPALAPAPDSSVSQ
jgi:hypothetical protein